MNREEILKKAIELVTVERTATHGEPHQNFATIAKLQRTYIEAIIAKRGDHELLPHDVAILNILQKIGRIVQTPEHIDHWVDIAGYAACGGQCVR